MFAAEPSQSGRWETGTNRLALIECSAKPQSPKQLLFSLVPSSVHLSRLVVLRNHVEVLRHLCTCQGLQCRSTSPPIMRINVAVSLVSFVSFVSPAFPTVSSLLMFRGSSLPTTATVVLAEVKVTSLGRHSRSAKRACLIRASRSKGEDAWIRGRVHGSGDGTCSTRKGWLKAAHRC